MLRLFDVTLCELTIHALVQKLLLEKKNRNVNKLPRRTYQNKCFQGHSTFYNLNWYRTKLLAEIEKMYETLCSDNYWFLQYFLFR